VGDATLAALAARWRLLCSGAAGGVTNMAIDAALLARARRTGVATLRVYAWDVPTLSLGRHERARGLFDSDRMAAMGVGVVRRPTGGRALLHHREVTYSVTAPDALSLTASYAAINQLLRDALARLGVEAHVAFPRGRPLRPEGAACFAEPGAGELVVHGAKLVGSAQLREDGALLQHGSILIADDQSMIATLRSGEAPRARETDRPTAAAATLESALGRTVGYGEVEGALIAAFAERTEYEALDPDSLRDDLGADLARLQREYADPEWTWRR
jgi:lipoate-protein ligase A